MQYECISNVVFEIAIDDGGGIKKLYISAIKMPLEDNMPMEVMWFVRIKGCWLAWKPPVKYVFLHLLYLGGWLGPI